MSATPELFDLFGCSPGWGAASYHRSRRRVALGASILSAVLFGLWPAWRSTKTDPQEVLQSSSRSATEGRKGNRLVAGCIFGQSDEPQRVAVISQNLADQLWPHESAIGRPLQPYNSEHRIRPFRVVGVVGSVHVSSLTKQAENMVYVPYWQRANSGMSLVVRTWEIPITQLAAFAA